MAEGQKLTILQVSRFNLIIVAAFVCVVSWEVLALLWGWTSLLIETQYVHLVTGCESTAGHRGGTKQDAAELEIHTVCKAGPAELERTARIVGFFIFCFTTRCHQDTTSTWPMGHLSGREVWSSDSTCLGPWVKGAWRDSDPFRLEDFTGASPEPTSLSLRMESRQIQAGGKVVSRSPLVLGALLGEIVDAWWREATRCINIYFFSVGTSMNQYESYARWNRIPGDWKNHSSQVCPNWSFLVTVVSPSVQRWGFLCRHFSTSCQITHVSFSYPVQKMENVPEF